MVHTTRCKDSRPQAGRELFVRACAPPLKRLEDPNPANHPKLRRPTERRKRASGSEGLIGVGPLFRMRSGGFVGLVSSSPAGAVPRPGAKAAAARRRNVPGRNRNYGRRGFIVRTFRTPVYSGSIYIFVIYQFIKIMRLCHYALMSPQSDNSRRRSPVECLGPWRKLARLPVPPVSAYSLLPICPPPPECPKSGVMSKIWPRLSYSIAGR